MYGAASYPCVLYRAACTVVRVTIKLFEAQDVIVRKVEPPDPNDFRFPTKWVPPTYQQPFADDSAKIKLETAKVQVGDDGCSPFPGRADTRARAPERVQGTMQTTPKGFESDWSGDGRALPFTVKK